MINVILQTPSTFETRAVRAVAMAAEFGAINILNASADQLPAHKVHLAAGAIPIGSVEFVRAAMSEAGVLEPTNMSYPPGCEPYLGRQVRTIRAGSVLGQWFVKPVATKRFNGFVFNSLAAPASLDEHDREQHEIFMSLDADEMVLVSEVVEFASEWRFYIDPCSKDPVGAARYDPDGSDDAPKPCSKVVAEFISQMDLKQPYAADFGVTADGQTVLVEVNDFWALGLYHGPESISGKDYLRLLDARWQSILGNHREQSISRTRENHG